jgi:hypothetical protein
MLKYLQLRKLNEFFIGKAINAIFVWELFYCIAQIEMIKLFLEILDYN